MDYNFVVDFLTREALEQCSLQDISIPRPQMQYMIKWLVMSNGERLFNANKETTLDIYQSIYDQIIGKLIQIKTSRSLYFIASRPYFVKDKGPVIQMLKLQHFFERSSFNHVDVQEKYEQITKDKLMPLLGNICTSNGTTKKDHDELIRKITTYIVASNKIFSPKNSEMMSLAKAALESILTKQDILDFVSRKKHYQLDYLSRLGKITCGILLFNKHTGQGGEAIRDVVDDVYMAYDNTLEALRLNMKKCNDLIKLGLRAISNSVTLNLVDKKLIYRLPKDVTIDDLELFNKFNYIHLHHESCMKKIKEHVLSLKKHIDHDVGQLKELIFKLHDVVKFRLAVPSESVFPHFTKLFETWYQILMRLYFLVEINKINDGMVEILASDYQFELMAFKISSNESTVTFEVPMIDMANEEAQDPVLRMKSNMPAANHLQRFCTLTLAATNGILIQSDSAYGVLQFQKQLIAFQRRDYLSFTEKNYHSVVKHFLTTAYEHPEMCLLFNIAIDLTPLDQSSIYGKKSSSKKKTFNAGIQTENCLPPSSIKSRNSLSWNIWDYRRRAIQMANLMKSKTHSTQTDLTYSTKNASVQTYEKRTSTHRCNGSSSQLSKSVCQKLDGKETATSLDFQC